MQITLFQNFNIMTSHKTLWNFVIKNGIRYLDTKLVCKEGTVMWTNKCFLYASTFGVAQFQCLGKFATFMYFIISDT